MNDTLATPRATSRLRGPLQPVLLHWQSPSIRQQLTRRTLIYFGIYFLFALPLMRANYFYVDDINRNFNGLFWWTSLGRPLASILMKAVNFNVWTLSDLAPLPLLMAAAILAVASAWTSMAFRLRPGVALLPVAFIVCNPFFIENLAYRYDCLIMASATSLAMAPVALETLLAGPALYACICGALLLVLNLYQPAINIFIVLSCCTALLTLARRDPRRAIRGFVAAVACLLITLVVYEFETRFIKFEPYAQPHTQFVSIHDPSLVLDNIRRCYGLLSLYLLHTHQTQLLLAGMALGFLVCIVALVRSGGARLPVSLSLVSLPLALLLILGMLGGIVGPVALLRHPVWAPRVLMGFGAVAAGALSLLVLHGQSRWLRRIVPALLVITLFGQFSLSYAFGNILIAQRGVDCAVGNQVVDDAFTLAHGDPRSLVILGRAPSPPNVLRETRAYPVLHRLLPSHQMNFWTWGPYLRLHGLPANIRFFAHRTPDPAIASRLASCRFRTISRRLYDNVYTDGSDIVIDFAKTCHTPPAAG